MRLSLVGPGRAGTSILQALAEAGHEVAGVTGRPGSPAAGRPLADACRDADVVLVAVPDREIGVVGAALHPFPGQVVAHLSGSLDVGAFPAWPDVGRAALHPLQTFPAPDPARARGIAWGVSADAGAWPVAERLVADLDGRILRVTDRVVYHAAGVFASNGLVALLGVAARLFEAAGVPDGVSAAAPLVRAAVENTLHLGAAGALTGPIARGDATTVAAHLGRLEGDEAVLYRAVGRAAARLVPADTAALTAALLAEPA